MAIDNDSEEAAIAEGINAFLQSMDQVSLALVRLDVPKSDEERPALRGSGLLVECNGDLLIVTCAHVVRRGEWGVEIRTSTSPGTSERRIFETPVDKRVTPIRTLASARTVKAWDFACISFEAGRGTTELGTLPTYKGPIDRRPVAGEPYGFISWNRDTILPLNVVERSPAFEVGMEFVGADESGMYRFRLAGEHKGHPFYRGASGAPIADREGAVVALLANGEEAHQDILKGVPFADAMSLQHF